MYEDDEQGIDLSGLPYYLQGKFAALMHYMELADDASLLDFIDACNSDMGAAQEKFASSEDLDEIEFVNGQHSVVIALHKAASDNMYSGLYDLEDAEDCFEVMHDAVVEVAQELEKEAGGLEDISKQMSAHKRKNRMAHIPGGEHSGYGTSLSNRMRDEYNAEQRWNTAGRVAKGVAAVGTAAAAANAARKSRVGQAAIQGFRDRREMKKRHNEEYQPFAAREDAIEDAYHERKRKAKDEYKTRRQRAGEIHDREYGVLKERSAPMRERHKSEHSDRRAATRSAVGQAARDTYGDTKSRIGAIPGRISGAASNLRSRFSRKKGDGEEAGEEKAAMLEDALLFLEEALEDEEMVGYVAQGSLSLLKSAGLINEDIEDVLLAED